MATPPPVPDSWFSDLIKIGIPSLVTMVAAMMTYLQVRSGHKKDLQIENLRSGADQAKINAAKKSDLVLQVVSKMGAVESAIGRHSGGYRGENVRLQDDPLPDDIVEKLRASHRDLNSAVDACIEARVMVSMFDDQMLAAAFEVYLESLYTFQVQSNPKNAVGQIKLNDFLQHVRGCADRVLKTLSAIHHGTPSAD